MSDLNKDMLFLILQFLEENKLTETLHKLEQESGIFFRFDYFEEKGMAGDWDEAEKYLNGFTKIDARDRGNGFIKKMYYLIRRQKYLEALDRHDEVKAVDVLKKDLKVFSDDEYKEKYKQLNMLLSFDNFRECKKFSKYGTINSVRQRTIGKLKRLIEVDPFFQAHLKCPIMNKSRLQTMVCQSLKRQHYKCQNQKSLVVIDTLFTDHACPSLNYTPQPQVKSSQIVHPTFYAAPNNAIGKVVRVLYTNAGDGILALGSTGTQKLWVWRPNAQNPQVTNGNLPHYNINPQRAVVPCVAISNDDSFVLACCGGKISRYESLNGPFQNLPPPAATFIAFHPYSNNIIAIGMEDSTIHIYALGTNMSLCKLAGPQKHITGLSFSVKLNILVSSSADTQLCFWSMAPSWELKKSLMLQMPEGKEPVGVTELQFHSDQERLLVCHKSLLAIYDASRMELIQQWVPPEAVSCGSITSATYSSNSELIYASLTDGYVVVLDVERFRLRYRINLYPYLPRRDWKDWRDEEPLLTSVVAAHPKQPNQLAIGLSDGGVRVIELVESEGTDLILGGLLPFFSELDEHIPCGVGPSVNQTKNIRYVYCGLK